MGQKNTNVIATRSKKEIKRLSKRGPDSESDEEEYDEEEEEEETECSSSDTECSRQKRNCGGGKIDRKKYRKMLADMFPSKYSKALAEYDDDDSYETESTEGKKSPRRRNGKKHHRKNRKEESDTEEEAEEEEEEEAEEDNDDSSSDNDDDNNEKRKKKPSSASRIRGKKIFRKKSIAKKTKKPIKGKKQNQKKKPVSKKGKKKQSVSSTEEDESDSTYVLSKESEEDSSSESYEDETELSNEDTETDADEENDSSSSDEDSSSEDADKNSNKINIILSVGGDEDEYADYFGHSDDDDDDDEECNTDDEETFMKGMYEKVITPPEEPSSTEDSDSAKNKKSSKKDKEKSKKNGKEDKEKSKKKAKKEEDDDENDQQDVESEYIELLELKKDLTKKFQKNPKSKILKKRIQECCDDIRKLVKTARKSNTKKYKKITAGEFEKPNEFQYFKKKLSNAEQLRVMRELKEVNRFMAIDKPYRLAILESNIPPKIKANAMQKINMLKSMEPCDSEYFKIKNWVDTFMRIPFCKYNTFDISINDGVDKCHEFMSNAKNVLDKCVYGLDDAKLQIMQMIGQWISNPDSIGTSIAIKGPPGTGKTTLVKDGISKILGREFVFIPLGGAGDASYLEGHSYTYEGSTWGKIVQSLIDCKSMNPVFYFDELDKISDTPKGEEITGILTHLTDTTQNSQFHDKYFSDVDFDLSKCLFIFSYNDEEKVNPILKDRMYRIHTKGYDTKEKIIIANQYMLPKIREQVNFQKEDIIIPDETIRYIVSQQHLTHKEDGVRNMKRCLEIIHTKLNLFRLVKSDENMFSKDIDMKVKFPFTVDTKSVDILIKNEEKQSQSLLSMYI